MTLALFCSYHAEHLVVVYIPFDTWFSVVCPAVSHHIVKYTFDLICFFTPIPQSHHQILTFLNTISLAFIFLSFTGLFLFSQRIINDRSVFHFAYSIERTGEASGKHVDQVIESFVYAEGKLPDLHAKSVDVLPDRIGFH